MPRVPSYDNFQTTPNTLPTGGFSTGMPDPGNPIRPSRAPSPGGPDPLPRMPRVDTPTPNVPIPRAGVQSVDTGSQSRALGQVLSQAGGMFGRIELDEMQRQNQLRVDDALNSAKELEMQLTLGRDTGFANLRGIQALQRQSGKPLSDEYGQQFDDGVKAIADGLGNDAQRRLFAQQAAPLSQRLRAAAMRHEAEQSVSYELSVREGTIALRTKEIGLRYNDPAAIDDAVTSIRAAAFDQARLVGKSATEAENVAQRAVSNGHKLALSAALQAGDLLYANAYLKRYGKQMDPDDLLQANGLITKELDNTIGVQAANEVAGRAVPKLQTSDTDRAFNILLGTESGGKQFDEAGKPLTSPKGAIGIAQIMPATGPEAAKLAGLKWDEERFRTDPDYNRALGKAYFGERLKVWNGDLAKAWAGYNAGDGRVKDGIAAAKAAGDGSTWLDHMPEETRNYVAKNMREYGAGGGAFERPTLDDLKAQLRENPMLAGNPARMKAAESALETRYRDMEAARKQTEETALDRAMRELYTNGGQMDALPVSVRAMIPGDKLGTVMRFADDVRKQGGATHSPEAWASLLSLPRAELAKMTPIEFFRQFRPVLDDAHLEKGYALIADAQGKADTQHLEIITTSERTKRAAIEAGIIPATGKSNEDQIKAFAQFETVLEQRVRQFEVQDLQGKRKATGDELQKIIDGVLIDKAYVPRSILSDKESPIALMTPEQQAKAYVTVGGKDIALASIPAAQRAAISAKLRARGMQISEQRIAELWVAAGKPQ